MQKQYKLDNLAKILSGYTFRQAITEDYTGNVRIIQAKNVDPTCIISDETQLTRIFLEQVRMSALVQDGDILLASRGNGVGDFRATVYRGKDRAVLASASVYIIRITNNKMLPEYLSIFFNSISGQRILAQKITGTIIKTLLIGNIREIEIDLPSIAEQKIIISLHDNIRKQERLLKKRITLLQDVLTQTVQNVHNQ